MLVSCYHSCLMVNVGHKRSCDNKYLERISIVDDFWIGLKFGANLIEGNTM